jgi:hypothetical protein
MFSNKIRYPGILLGESYNDICTLVDLFVIVKIPNRTANTDVHMVKDDMDAV